MEKNKKKDFTIFNEQYTSVAVKKFDFDSPEMKAEIAECLRQQRECIARTIVTPQDLERRFTI